jgi:YidC/Oxa1 family membrane protein insertase
VGRPATLNEVSAGSVLGPLIAVEEWILESLHAIGLGWGFAIVGLTLLVRVALVPLTVRQIRAQRELSRHAPELTGLRNRHRDDPERLKRETLAYYREHRVNPLGAIGPTLLQIPVFISLYYLLRADVASGLFGHAGFLFIPDLTRKPHGTVLVALMLLYLTSQLITSAVSTRKLKGGQRKLALALPLLFIGVVGRLPAGLLIYWITSSLWSLGQALVLWRTAPASASLPRSPAPHPKPPRRSHPASKKRRQRKRRRRGAG